jgi:hypothetical protein
MANLSKARMRRRFFYSFRERESGIGDHLGAPRIDKDETLLKTWLRNDVHG